MYYTWSAILHRVHGKSILALGFAGPLFYSLQSRTRDLPNSRTLDGEDSVKTGQQLYIIISAFIQDTEGCSTSIMSARWKAPASDLRVCCVEVLTMSSH